MRTIYGVRIVLAVVSVAAALAAGAGFSAAQSSENVEVVSEIRAYVAAESSDVRRVYEDRQYKPLWQIPSPFANVRDDFGAHISGVVSTGVPSAFFPDINAPGRSPQFRSLKDVARADVALTVALTRYLVGQRLGFVGHGALGEDWQLQAEYFDPVAAVLTAIDVGRVETLFDDVRPNHPQYQSLRQELTRLQTIMHAGGWPVIAGPDELRLGEGDPREEVLKERLIIEGDISEAATADRLALNAAVQNFQRRHGLSQDGRIGRRTLAALSMQVEDRISTLTVNLERWRHVPRTWGDRYVHVNTADASLVLVEGGEEMLHMRTIAGDPAHATPVMDAMITAVTLNPAWTIPYSIATQEILPKLRHNPRYLLENDMIIVGDTSGDPHGLKVDWARISASQFPYVLRQQPGEHNALGAVKFEMANDNAVFLHDTPNRSLFARSERNLSHGCVRLERPVDLACQILYGGVSDETRAQVAGIAAEGETRTLAVQTPIPVYILYWTAFVDRTGQLNFRPDVYGRDADIANALKRLRGARPS